MTSSESLEQAGTVTVEILSFAGCPNRGPAIQMVGTGGLPDPGWLREALASAA